MDIQSILADLKRERDRLNSAIAALEGAGPRRRGRPAGSGAGSSAASGARRPRRHMSAAARKRISEMMKQRWAERKRKAKS
jgi:50S ribosomal subunit-associated GTPase HflX